MTPRPRRDWRWIYAEFEGKPVRLLDVVHAVMPASSAPVRGAILPPSGPREDRNDVGVLYVTARGHLEVLFAADGMVEVTDRAGRCYESAAHGLRVRRRWAARRTVSRLWVRCVEAAERAAAEVA